MNQNSQYLAGRKLGQLALGVVPQPSVRRRQPVTAPHAVPEEGATGLGRSAPHPRVAAPQHPARGLRRAQPERDAGARALDGRAAGGPQEAVEAAIAGPRPPSVRRRHLAHVALRGRPVRQVLQGDPLTGPPVASGAGEGAVAVGPVEGAAVPTGCEARGRPARPAVLAGLAPARFHYVHQARVLVDVAEQ